MTNKQSKPLDFRIALIAARWHAELVTVATNSCYSELLDLGIDAKSNVKIFNVPGSLEIPLASKLIIQTGGWDAVIAFGLVVDGGIYRHEFVAQTVLNGIMSVTLETKTPVISAVLTPQQFDENDNEQIEFFQKHLSMKGAEAARSAVQTIQAAQLIRRPES